MAELHPLLAQLSPKQRLQLAEQLGLADKLTSEQKAFLMEYSVDLDEYRAAADCGATSDMVKSLKASIMHLAEKSLEQREKECALKADFVRQYIKDVLEFCPTDWLSMDVDGDYVCDVEKFSRAPHQIKRLVESVEFKQTRSGRQLKLNFVSKTAALGLAARYTLVQKFQAEMSVVPWEQIAAAAPRQTTVEEDVAARLQGPIQATSTALAGRPVLRPAA